MAASTSAAGPSPASKESPNWLEMPNELMENILQRLGTMEILKSARRVCTTWRTICNDPAWWKVIYVHKPIGVCETNYDFEKLTKQAVDLSCGELIDVSLVSFGSNDLLDYIVLRSNKIKRLSLMSCHNITRGLISTVKRLPQLEELHISFTPINVKDIEAIGQNCPQLKYFMLDKRLIRPYSRSVDYDALAIAYNMPELRHLKLINKAMTNYGLESILDGCPHLQSLDVRMCYRLRLNGNLGKLCMERIKDFKSDLTQI